MYVRFNNQMAPLSMQFSSNFPLKQNFNKNHNHATAALGCHRHSSPNKNRTLLSGNKTKDTKTSHPTMPAPKRDTHIQKHTSQKETTIADWPRRQTEQSRPAYRNAPLGSRPRPRLLLFKQSEQKRGPGIAQNEFKIYEK